MTLEQIRQALLRLSHLDLQMNSVRAHLLGDGGTAARDEFLRTKREIEDASPGWSVQHMSNSWASTWVLLPFTGEE